MAEAAKEGEEEEAAKEEDVTRGDRVRGGRGEREVEAEYKAVGLFKTVFSNTEMTHKNIRITVFLIPITGNENASIGGGSSVEVASSSKVPEVF